MTTATLREHKWITLTLNEKNLTTQKAEPRTDDEVRVGDVVEVKPHIVTANLAGWSASAPHPFSGETGTVLQITPVNSKAIIRISTRNGMRLTAADIDKLRVLIEADLED